MFFEGPLEQYTAVANGSARRHGKICPMIAVPTMSGTGSEVGRAAVIITSDGRKLGILSAFMLPNRWRRVRAGGQRHIVF
jgi:4-hydroxybutyrate dehydrogenase